MAELDRSDSSAYITYEVTIPTGEADQIAALQGLRRTFDWNLRARTTLPGDLDRSDTTRPWVIEEENFLGISQQVWEVDTYGRNAVDQLRYEAIKLNWKMGVLWRNGFNNADENNPRYRLDEIDVLSAQLSPAQMRSRAQEVWNMQRFPFELDHDEISDRVPRGLNLRPGPVTRDRLADYVRAHGYDRHELHGALGKTLDLFGIAAGVVNVGDIQPDGNDADFIEDTELQALMEAQISRAARQRIRSLINDHLEAQFDKGSPVNDYEIIVEGLTTRRNNHPWYWMTYERIATASLRSLTSRYTRDSQGRRFLQQF